MKARPTIKSHLAMLELEANLRSEIEAKSRLDDMWSKAAQLETAALEARRGVELLRPESRPGEHRKPMRRLRGLDWLLRHSKLGPASEANRRAVAGAKYGEDFQAATTVPIGSCSAGNGERVDGNPVRQAAEMKMHDAAQRIYAARARGLHGNKSLILVSDAILGEGHTPLSLSGGDRPQAIRHEAAILIALDLLINFYGAA